VSSIVLAPPAAVWERIASFEGVNDELMPIVRMTCPPEHRRIDPATVPLGRPWFRSWLLLFGVLPIDWDHLTLVAIDPPHGFHEDSTMLSPCGPPGAIERAFVAALTVFVVYGLVATEVVAVASGAISAGRMAPTWVLQACLLGLFASAHHLPALRRWGIA